MNKIYKIKLSPYHKIFYNEWQLNPLSSKYNIVFDQTINNTLDILRLRNALERLIAEHFILNSHIITFDGEPYWITNSTIRHLDVFNDVASYEQIYDYVSQSFNVVEEPLYRFAIFKQADGNYRLVLVGHHLLGDGCSFDELVYEISSYYNDYTYKCKFNLTQQIELISSLTDKFDKQLKLVEAENKKFWNNSLSDLEPVDLRFIKSSSSRLSESTAENIKEVAFYFEADVVDKVQQLKAKYGLSLYSYGQIIFAILLHKYTSQNKFGLCYPIEIREFSGLLLGTGVNTNIFPFTIDKNTTILDLITHSKNFVSEIKNKSFNHRHLPINEIIAKSDKGLLDVFFIQTNLKDTKFEFDNADVLKINTDFNIDLPSKLLFEQELKYQLLNYRVRYNVTEIDEIILERFINHYKTLFIDVLLDLEQNNPDKYTSEYHILTTQEYNKIVYEWNVTDKPYSENKTISQLFEEQVLKTPNDIAVVYQDIKITYQELNQRANQLAHYMVNKYRIQPDDLIAICLDRSELVLIAIFAVLKSGAAYVPLDPSYPDDRIAHTLKDTRAKVVITNHIHEERLNSLKISNTQSIIISNVLAMDNPVLQSKIILESTDNLVMSISDQNLAYVIYTSGTTNKPKGVMIEHKSLVNLIINQGEKIYKALIGNNRQNLTYNCLNYANYVFDAHVWEIFITLLFGHKLHILPNQARKDINLLKNYILNEQIDMGLIPPALLNENELLAIKLLVVGGDKTASGVMDAYYKAGNHINNAYGPTESTVYATINHYSNNGCNNIGKPIDNIKCYILDINCNPVPQGAIGELYIGGVGLARGYLNLPELTAEKFIVNPFQSESEKLQRKNSRLYKTGDLCRFLSDGHIEYIGRNDFQVKIRGYRIELAEIEAVLASYPPINQAVVIVSDTLDTVNSTGNKYLVGYYVAEHVINHEEIVDYLAGKLPQYMIPNIFIHIAKIPLTINGKLDKLALPRPSLEPNVNDYVAPRNEIEQIICKGFSDTFSIPLSQISVNSDFFRLGGDSLMVISLVIKLQQYNLIIGADEIFKLRTPAKIALNVKYHENSLNKQFHNMKTLHHKMQNLAEKDIIAMSKKKEAYLQSIKQLEFEQTLKPIKNVLLTGATGHLGCNLLHQLLSTTPYNVILLVRDSSDEKAYNRLKAKFMYYFNENIDEYQSRIKVLASDIRKENLGLEADIYRHLSETTDSIIHSAALVSHYGDYDDFYQTNIQSTINLLKLSKLTALKDFHYISTASVLTDGYIPEYSYYNYVEGEDVNDKLIRGNNIYCQTKLDGEMAVIEYRAYGVNGNIYRVGNLSINSQSCKIQEDFENNAFFLRVKTVLNLGIVPQELASVEISPVDCTALAIVKLFQQKSLSNEIYHVFNPNQANLYKLFSKYEHINIRMLTFNDFIDTIMERLLLKDDNDENGKLLELFILHQGWLRTAIDTNNITKIEVLQNRTEAILAQLNFKWPEISSNMLSEIIKKSF